ncbi:MAG: response regulator [Candidatus Kariarchaeaceae archaeon]
MVRVLVCDDAKFMAKISQRLLEKMGHEVVYQATNGDEVVNYYSRNWMDVDIILLDVVMPKMDGLQALRHILRINPQAKVIMVTAISNTSIVTGAMRVGAKEFVTKPFRLSEFVKAINKVISMQ